MQLALNDQTKGIIGAREIGLMKPTSLFINTARGKLVDQPALTDAVANGRIGGVALDVYYDEPLPIDDPLARSARPPGRPGDADSTLRLAKPLDLGARLAGDLVQRLAFA